MTLITYPERPLSVVDFHRMSRAGEIFLLLAEAGLQYFMLLRSRILTHSLCSCCAMRNVETSVANLHS